MSSAVILQHAPYAGPGRIVPVFRDFGIPIDIRRLYQGDEVPTDLDAVRVRVGEAEYELVAREPAPAGTIV